MRSVPFDGFRIHIERARDHAGDGELAERALLRLAAEARAQLVVAEQAVQLHGGMGMTDELDIGHGLKRIALLGRLFGDPASGVAQFAAAA